MDEGVTEQIIEAIADVEGIEPENLNSVLEDDVSTDAIRELVNHSSNSWRLQFETRNHIIQVMGNNTILVDGEQKRAFV
jgi:hypothetical protein